MIIIEERKTCCFTGHRNIPINEYENIQNVLEKTIISLIKKMFVTSVVVVH